MGLHKRPPQLSKLHDVAWLAGLLEGEGCFTLAGKDPHIQLNMTDKDVVGQAAFLFGGMKVGMRNAAIGNSKAQWRVQASGQRAIMIMEAILPFMGQRRSEKIKSILASTVVPPVLTGD
jgi:hypothetical protein